MLRHTTGRRAATGLAAGMLGVGLALAGSGPALAGPPEDRLSMACNAVKQPSDPAVAGALALYGIQAKDVKGEVGIFCTPTEDPAVANFCAVDNQRDAFIALGNRGPCFA